jgi:predicted RNA methylase
MSRLSKAQIKAHQEAVAILSKDRLSDDEREFVLDNWQESANHVNSAAGAFFTPSGLGLDAALFLGLYEGGRVIDLCAGIGCLALSSYWRWGHSPLELVCVEINPAYVDVGRKLLPEARWICAGVNDLPADIGHFDRAISNPPFGKTAKIASPRYAGEDDLAVVDVASCLADFGTFILPGGSVPFEYSGCREYKNRSSAKYDRFTKATGIELTCESVDCEVYRNAWRGVKPRVEVVSADFTELLALRQPVQADMLDRIAA